MNKFLIILVISSLLISMSFLGGADLLMRHFCSVPSAGGLCGVLQGISGIIGHLSFIQTLLVFLPALLAVLLLSYNPRPDHESGTQSLRPALLPTLLQSFSLEERSWLAYHTNSPNIR